MCGFLGQFNFEKINDSLINESNSHLVCRGPDKCKKFKSNNDKVEYKFIFNRLSILDLSDEADQPMTKGEASLMFNGEIYNHLELRKKLEKKGIEFKTKNSDTELVINSLKYLGLNSIENFRGMFSIFFHNEKEKTFYLIKDRVGQKPLYYYSDKNTFSFSSNLKSLLNIYKNKEISEKHLNEYLIYGSISSPNTLFKNFKSLLPGEIIKIDYSNKNFEINKSVYWKIENYLDNKVFDRDEFNEILEDSIQIRNEADVPISSFLSGGIDSTTIVKYLKKFNNEVNTFSVHVENKKYDESKWSDLVAKKYQTNHTSVKVSSKIDPETIDEALKSLDQPYSDPSVVPSFILSKEISKYFKVALTGDGGDELLGGYKRTQLALNNPPNFISKVSKLYNLYPPYFGTGNLFLSKSPDLKIRYSSFLEDKNLMKLLRIDASNIDNIEINRSLDSYKAMLLADYKFFLPEMMLFKIDRTSMANSLELRSPFVDHKLVEYIFSHDANYYNIQNPKSILKYNLIEDFDDKFLNRNKQGFVFDIENWIFNNFDLLNHYFVEGQIINKFNVNKLNLLKRFRTRINSHRLWKLFVIEKYLADIS